MDSTHQIKLIFSHLPKPTRDAFELLSQQNFLKDNKWYLAGGTALALQIGHRVSIDLDFFTHEKDFDAEIIIESLSPHQWITTLREKGTLYGELKGSKISFISYPYFVPKQPFITYNNIDILDVKDIIVMKIIAISQRGRKRDFFDLYWYITHKEPLIDIMKCVNIQYPNLSHNYHHIIKSLTYFDEAEEDPDPQIFFDAAWKDVKKHFFTVVPDIADKLL